MDDDILEDRESFEIVLQATSTGVFLGEPSTAPVWIEDNDRECVCVCVCVFSINTSQLNASVYKYFPMPQKCLLN